MFLQSMRHEPVTSGSRPRFDWQGPGYLISAVSVLLLGAIAWPGPGDPDWHLPVIILGMATSVIGMGFRYKSHLDQQREVEKAKAEARRS